MHDSHRRSLKALEHRRRLRTLIPRRGLDFSSNDYLGLAESDALRAAGVAALERGVPVGAGGSRLLRGNHPEHEMLEQEAARYFGSEAALFFGGGFAANTALFATLPERGDLIIYDALIHASVRDGMAMSRAEHRTFVHNDADSAEAIALAWRKAGGTGAIWIAAESLYSMDGDCAPLGALHEVARRHDGVLVIDEAHATGVLGNDGRGLGAALEGRDNVVALHTCGKALGVSGALITLPRVLADYMVNRARPFIYATAPSPLVAAVVRAALNIVGTQPELRRRHGALVGHAGEALSAACRCPITGTHIQPILLKHDEKALAAAHQLAAAGFDVRAVRPPTVPEGTSRLRISLTLNVTENDVTRLAETLAPLVREAAA